MEIRKWQMSDINKDKIRALAKVTGLDELICEVMAARGFKTEQQLQEFFTDELYSPFLLPDMEKAAKRVQKAIDCEESICVYGDYDCDGISSTVLLYTYLQNMGANASYYIPDRNNEGYGMNMKAVETLASRGVSLIITVDNGSSAIDEIDRANALGMQVVVTDHHKLREVLPNAVAVVNPHRSDCTAPFKELAGVGVVFKLICAMEGGGGAELLEYYGDLTCIGTIADVVPLTGENRTIVRYGLERLQFTDSAGIRALMQAAGIGEKPVSCENVAFMLAPRINAAGRMGCTEKAVQLLLCEDDDEAAELALFISEQNKLRQSIEAKIIKDIAEKTAKEPKLLMERLLVLCGEGWHHGIIGIVCSKITERYAKPCLLISIDGDEARGSGRSVEGFSLIDAVADCSELLTRYGGHNMAAGFSLKTKQLEAFKAQLLADAKRSFAIMPSPSVHIDKIITPKELSIENIAKLKILEPFGMGNEAPVFAIMNLKIEALYSIGADGGHLRLRLSSGSKSFYAVYFGMPLRRFAYKAGEYIDIAAHCEISSYNGEEQVTVKIKTVRPAGQSCDEILKGRAQYEGYQRGEGAEKPLVPSRDDIAVIYRFLRQNGGFCGEPEQLYLKAAPQMSYCKLRLALDIMAEMCIINLDFCETGVKVEVCAINGKVELENSQILRQLINN
ncbi:MAG: single-stranded-DNA-specific exonuclease RecJ [Hydrogenoanaerobacterium sp.]